MRTATNTFCKTSPPKRGIRSARQPKSCLLCKQAGRPDSSHFLSECCHLPEDNRKFIAKARQIANIFDEPLEDSRMQMVQGSMMRVIALLVAQNQQP